VIFCVAGLGLGGCGKLQGFGGPATPLVTFNIVVNAVNGDLTPLRPANDTGEQSLQVALVWGAQWLTEPFCILPSTSDSAPVIAAGCRDPFGFVPARVAQSAPITLGTPTTLSLFSLPSADLLVGDATSRVAYASLVFYDDHDRSSTLELSMPHRAPTGADDGPPEDHTQDSKDIIYGASFLTMTASDQRVAYLEGTFVPSAFYPRSGCPDPTMAFSVLGAGGFSADAGLASAALGTLPTEDPSQCSPSADSPPSAGKPSDPLISITAQAPAIVNEVGCAERTNDGSIRYREPPASALDLADRVTACAPLPSFDAGGQTNLTQFVVSGTSAERCRGLTHYTLRGCREDVTCAVPDWDFTAMPPSWWPCSN
jgi:hypothetical protein